MTNQEFAVRWSHEIQTALAEKLAKQDPDTLGVKTVVIKTQWRLDGGNPKIEIHLRRRAKKRLATELLPADWEQMSGSVGGKWQLVIDRLHQQTNLGMTEKEIQILLGGRRFLAVYNSLAHVNARFRERGCDCRLLITDSHSSSPKVQAFRVG